MPRLVTSARIIIGEEIAPRQREEVRVHGEQERAKGENDRRDGDNR